MEPVTSRRITVDGQRRGVRARGRGAAPARPLPARRPRPDRHARRLRHGQLRRLHRHLRRRAREELHAARGPGRRRDDRDGRGLAQDGELTTLQQAFSDHHALQCGYCTPGMLMSATALLRDNPRPTEERDPQGDPGEHLPLHGLREHRRGDQGGGEVTETTVTPSGRSSSSRARRSAASPARASRARRTSGSSRARASSSTTSSGTGWATSTSSARRTRTRRSCRSTSRRRSSSAASTARSPATRSRSSPIRSSSSRCKPGADIKDYALAVGKVRHVGEPVAAVVASSRELARDAAELVEVEYEPLPRRSRRARRRSKDEVDPARRRRLERRLVRASSTGATTTPRSRRPTTSSGSSGCTSTASRRRRSSAPACLVEYNRGTGQWTIYGNHQMPGIGAIWMAPALRVGIDKLRFVTQDIGGALRQQDLPAPAVRRVLPARAQAQPAGAVDGVAHRPAHGERARQRAHVPRRRGAGEGRRDDARASRCARSTTAARSRATSRSAASSGRRSRPGCYRWRNIRVDFTQVCTNKSPVVAEPRLLADAAPLADRARRSTSSRSELGLDPVEVRKRNYVRADEMPYETPNGCVYDSGDYARCARHRARADRLRRARGEARATRSRAASCSASASARRSTRARTTSASRRCSTRSCSSRGTTRSRR